MLLTSLGKWNKAIEETGSVCIGNYWCIRGENDHELMIMYVFKGEWQWTDGYQCIQRENDYGLMIINVFTKKMTMNW